MSALTSIVVPCHDNLLYTALCLDSIAKHTPERHEVVVVDNGCTDGTADWCAERGARVVRSPVNLGFAGGVNLGMAHAAGEVVVILNNDALATPGWLAAMLDALAREEGVGIVGPRSNWVSDDQILVGVPYAEAPSDELDRFAAWRSCLHAGEGRRLARLSGLCMAIAPALRATIGGFDTRFAIGNLEDDDYTLRARMAGFELWVADDSFIHHFGHRTFALIDEDYGALLDENRLRYCAKWDFPLDGDPRGLLPGRAFDPARDRIALPETAPAIAA